MACQPRTVPSVNHGLRIGTFGVSQWRNEIGSVRVESLRGERMSRMDDWTSPPVTISIEY
ncbi:uncharacterized protein An05g01530 [Aspergillus niger]|uniref:Contig An05c0050, genomic contig n=2 Tax=Aspergillus niger TaxID=5061 RepID=A2QKV5_ASPNC|nr:uncharacterized protein An05g01530 [Aspergillus niger]CAK96492.1 unnamed protein product [Aspergillus niger]